MNRRQSIAGLLAGLATVLSSTGAQAQLRLPNAQLPPLPLSTLPQTVTQIGTVPPLSELRQLRAIRMSALLREHPREVDRDRDGNAVVRGRLLAIEPSNEALAAARAGGFSIVSDRTLAGLDLRRVVLQAPPNMTTVAAIDRLRALDPGGSYDLDPLFDAGESRFAVRGRQAEPGGAGGAHASGAQSSAARPDAESVDAATDGAPREPVDPATDGAPRTRVGLIDSGIDATHPAFRQTSIRLFGCDGKSVASEHGTAVASLLVGRSSRVTGALDHGELFGADVYCGRPTGGAADAIVDALSWLAERGVGVINVSLVGPKNLLLERAVRAAAAKGHIIVAAVGNDGPAAPPLYPAAYADVIGVTGVDARDKVLLEACRGPQVFFAAPGLQLQGAAPGGAYRSLRGTSFAAPLVAGLLARGLSAPDTAAARRVIEDLVGQALDLGAPGRDPVYGNGFVGGRFRAPGYVQ